ncbi:MAG: exodeoxyribonuclease VII large subunit [Azospirillaceae bacterium]
MTQDLMPPPAEPPSTGGDGNQPPYSVSEISGAIKRTIEGGFEHVRVRGEIGRVSRPRSGHVYLSLKDENAVLDAVIWRGVAGRLALAPEEGLEVIATGRVTTFAGQSKYQLVVEQLEMAGEGALLKMLEERRKRLAAEGLFDEGRKRRLPFLPSLIGVVTSPSGAVIRDILHRLADRFPRHVLLWPVAVQGERAAAEISAAIAGFNALPIEGPVRRPDVLIVARGGGSLEDLMAFNEESVVRAAAASGIPLISAVGHETDTTLIDFAADRRAPTPSAAAEMAVPVRAELLADIADRERRRIGAMVRLLGHRQTGLASLGRALGDPRRLLEPRAQRLDQWIERLDRAPAALLERRRARLDQASARLVHPRQQLAQRAQLLAQWGDRLAGARLAGLRRARDRFGPLAGRLTAEPVRRRARQGRRDLAVWAERLGRAGDGAFQSARDRLVATAKLLESFSYRRVLDRGFAVVRDASGAPVGRAAALADGMAVTLELADGSRQAVIGEGGQGPGPAPRPASRPAPGRDRSGGDDQQGSLL